MNNNNKNISFANSLVQNIASGNTIVLNRAAKQLITETAKNAALISHDWWCYIMVSGAGGKIHYDPEVTIKYQQHSKNTIGHRSKVFNLVP